MVRRCIFRKKNWNWKGKKLKKWNISELQSQISFEDEKKHTIERYEITSFKTTETQLHVNSIGIKYNVEKLYHLALESEVSYLLSLESQWM